MIKKVIKNNIQHLFLPVFLLFLSKFNEKYYLYSDHGSLVPLYMVRILLFFFGIWASIFIESLIGKYRELKQKNKKIDFNEKQKSFFLIFIWFLIWYGFWFIIYYPGSYTTDTLEVIEQFSYMKITDWFSYLHPLLYLFLYQFYPKLIIIGISQILLCSFVYADIISYFYSRFIFKPIWKISMFSLFVALFSSITSITYYTFFYMRDIPYGILHLYLAFYLFKICLDEGTRKLSKKQLIVVFGLSMVLSIYRGEGWIVLVTILFCLLLYGKFTLKFFAKISVFSLCVFFVLNFLVPTFLNVQPTRKNYYNLNLVAYPLGFILREGEHYISTNYKKDEEILSKVIDVKEIQKYTNCYGILQYQPGSKYWKGHRQVTDEEWVDFYKRTYKIFIENPHLFLAARVANFVSHLFVFKDRGERINDKGRFWLNYNECNNNILTFPKLHPGFVFESKPRWCNKIPLCYKNNGVCGYTNFMILDKYSMEWHWNSTIALLLAILVLCLYKYMPVSAIASAVILCRIPLVFLTSPFAFFRYIFSLYLFGVFVVLFVVLELTKEKT